MRGEQRASGDGLTAFLAREWDGRSLVRVSPPRSWAALKPGLWAWLRARRESGLPVPRFAGYPRCGFGADWLELDCAPGDAAPAACGDCGVRASCSPPAEWHEELQPFSGAPPLELWRRYRARLAALVALDPRIDALVEAHVNCDVAVTRRNPITLEPSLTLGDTFEPSVRLAIFRGPPLVDGGAAICRTERLVDSWAELHSLIGVAAPAGLTQALKAFAPCSFSLGLDARRDRPLLLKGYLEAMALTAEEKRVRVGELARLAGLSGEWPIPWDAVELVAVGTLDGRVASLKLYVRRHPAGDWPEFLLPAVAREHALFGWSSGQAYAVIDLAAVEPRPPKWDFALRQQLLTGAMLAADSHGLFGVEARRALGRVAAHGEFRTDVVAAGWRAGRCTLYLDLS